MRLATGKRCNILGIAIYPRDGKKFVGILKSELEELLWLRSRLLLAQRFQSALNCGRILEI